MEGPLSFPKHDEGEPDILKNSGSEEDDIGYHSIGRNIKVKFHWLFKKTYLALINLQMHGSGQSISWIESFNKFNISLHTQKLGQSA